MTGGKVIVSGFGPWSEVSDNPTLRVLERLVGRDWRGIELTTLPLPVDTNAIAKIVAGSLGERQPDLWIALGVNPGGTVIEIERIAANIRDFGSPDIAGETIDEEPVIEDGPAAYLSTLPVKRMAATLREAGFPACVSNSAGTFLCNQLMYTVLHLIAVRRMEALAGFVHIPLTTDRAAGLPHPEADPPAMDVETITEAVALAIDLALEFR